MGCSSSKDGVPGVRMRRDDFVEGTTVAYKVVTMGDQGVGKSSIVTRLSKGQFEEGAIGPTIGAAFVSHTVSVKKRGPSNTVTDEDVKLHVWDTSGEEAYRAITKSFFRDAYAAVLVYDVCTRSTFDNIRAWVNDFRAICPDAVIVLVGNKADKAGARTVSAEDAHALATGMGLRHFECSAKTGLGVTDVFAYVAARLHGGL